MAKRQKDRQHNGQKTEGQTTQWPKDRRTKNKQRSTKYTHKTKDRVTRTPLSGPSLKTQKFETFIILGNYSYYWILYEFSVKM